MWLYSLEFKIREKNFLFSLTKSLVKPDSKNLEWHISKLFQEIKLLSFEIPIQPDISLEPFFYKTVYSAS